MIAMVWFSCGGGRVTAIVDGRARDPLAPAREAAVTAATSTAAARQRPTAPRKRGGAPWRSAAPARVVGLRAPVGTSPLRPHPNVSGDTAMNLTQAASAAAIAAGVFGGLAIAPASARGSAPLTCGSVITEDTRLTADLDGCVEYGLVVGAPDITIDLAGHTISGTGVFVTRSGVYNDGHDGVTVKGGSIRNFSLGVDAYQAMGSTYEHLTISETLDGISLNDSDGSRVATSHLHHNRTGLANIYSDHSSFVANVIVDNSTQGISDRTSVGNTYAFNLISGNEFSGLDLESVDTAVERNLFVANGMDGMYATGSGLRLVGNTAVFSDGSGLRNDGSGGYVAGNVALFNRDFGITTTDDTVDGGRNRAVANGERNCVNVRCR
jgi:hypothetical protein